MLWVLFKKHAANFYNWHYFLSGFSRCALLSHVPADQIWHPHSSANPNIWEFVLTNKFDTKFLIFQKCNFLMNASVFFTVNESASFTFREPKYIIYHTYKIEHAYLYTVLKRVHERVKRGRSDTITCWRILLVWIVVAFYLFYRLWCTFGMIKITFRTKNSIRVDLRSPSLHSLSLDLPAHSF